jgi:hypothetical protein
LQKRPRSGPRLTPKKTDSSCSVRFVQKGPQASKIRRARTSAGLALLAYGRRLRDHYSRSVSCIHEI